MHLKAFVTKYYPAQSMATALGWGLGIGRIGAISGPVIVGFLLSMNVDLEFLYICHCLIRCCNWDDINTE